MVSYMVRLQWCRILSTVAVSSYVTMVASVTCFNMTGLFAFNQQTDVS